MMKRRRLSHAQKGCFHCEQFGPVAYCTTCGRGLCAPELPSAKSYTTTDGKITQTYCGGCYQ